MPRRRRAENFSAIADINVINLVDVALTLLIIFIMTAPIVQGAVEVQVPRARAETITSPEGIIVSVARDGTLYIGDAPVEWDLLEPALRDAVRAGQTDNVFLKADEGVEYGQVLQVLGLMRSMDIATVGLLAEPEAVRETQ